MAEMLAMVAAAAAQDRALVGGRREGRLGEDGFYPSVVIGAEGGEIGADATCRQGRGELVHLEQLRHEAPVPGEAVLDPAAALLGAVAEADDPFGRQLLVVGHL